MDNRNPQRYHIQFLFISENKLGGMSPQLVKNPAIIVTDTHSDRSFSVEAFAHAGINGAVLKNEGEMGVANSSIRLSEIDRHFPGFVPLSTKTAEPTLVDMHFVPLNHLNAQPTLAFMDEVLEDLRNHTTEDLVSIHSPYSFDPPKYDMTNPPSETKYTRRGVDDFIPDIVRVKTYFRDELEQIADKVHFAQSGVKPRPLDVCEGHIVIPGIKEGPKHPETETIVSSGGERIQIIPLSTLSTSRSLIA